jgi:hypothetical protein
LSSPGALPPFPLDALPPATREFVYAAAETVQAPVDMIGSCALGMLEIACRGRYPVRLSRRPLNARAGS